MPFAYELQASYLLALQASFLALAHPFWLFLRYFDTPAFYMLVASLAAGTLPRRLGMRYGCLIVLTLYANHLIKRLCNEPRPAAYDASLDLTGIGSHYGFPSGAAMGSIVIACVLIRHLPCPALRWLLAGLYVLFIGLSRLYLGAHFFTDILGGWAFGILSWLIFLACERWLAARPPLSRWQILLVASLGIPALYLLHPHPTTLSVMAVAAGLTGGLVLLPQGTPAAPNRWTWLAAPLGSLAIFQLARLMGPQATELGYVLIGLWLSWGIHLFAQGFNVGSYSRNGPP